MKLRQKPPVIKETGLRRGQAAIIARIHRMSLHHVNECARGRRVPGKELARTLQKYREQNNAAAA